MKKLLFVLFGIISFAITSHAQPQKIVADKIVAVVGDKIILQSDIENTIKDAIRNGGTVPEGAECTILEQALVSKLLMLQAMRDSIPVSEEEIESELDNRIRYYISQFGSQSELERVAGKTIYQLKDDSRESVRERKLAEAMQRKLVDNVNVTPTEVKAYFDRIPKDSLPFFESEVEVCQIAVYPKASRDLEKYMIDELTRYKTQIESKQMTFDQAARMYSEDPGTKNNGGLFEADRNDKGIDPSFLAAAFRLKDGEISPVIKSQFGYHLIQMVQRNGDQATVRHILKIPPVTDAEIKEGISKLDSVRSKIIAGVMDFNGAAFKYGEDEEQKYTGPCIMSADGDTYNRYDELDKDITAALTTLKVGEYSQPAVFVNERTGKKGVRILYFKTRTEPHRMNLKDDYNKIKQATLEEKKYQAMEKWLNGHIASYYIMIDSDKAGCDQLQKWANVAKTYASK
ncbi:MAG: peptidylprolyl isomerase [Flavisolibacter sp.]|nr:peptidylprolyl isomerase [Flavisolibacter sp.]